MIIILLEAAGALLLLLLIVWWTMFSDRDRGELRDRAPDDQPEATAQHTLGVQHNSEMVRISKAPCNSCTDAVQRDN